MSSMSPFCHRLRFFPFFFLPPPGCRRSCAAVLPFPLPVSPRPERLPLCSWWPELMRSAAAAAATMAPRSGMGWLAQSVEITAFSSTALLMMPWSTLCIASFSALVLQLRKHRSVYSFSVILGFEDSKDLGVGVPPHRDVRPEVFPTEAPLGDGCWCSVIHAGWIILLPRPRLPPGEEETGDGVKGCDDGSSELGCRWACWNRRGGAERDETEWEDAIFAAAAAAAAIAAAAAGVVVAVVFETGVVAGDLEVSKVELDPGVCCWSW
mmetsp:Transcript_3762/g.11010  ORF Transcript_3762/g.11010 Transcript_3762/m.11010 type:complete len:266 (-) Transcript_3762:176-973(-)